MPSDERHGAVGVDPVTVPQLADEPEGVARSGPATTSGERRRPGLERPAPGVERGERDSLLLGGHVERVRLGVAEEVLAGGRGRAALRFAAGGAGGFDLRPQPLAGAVDPLAHAVGVDAGGSDDLLRVGLRGALDRSSELVGDLAGRLLEAPGMPLVVGHEAMIA
jgi:hypothetical protein